jgi:hypothetical protein
VSRCIGALAVFLIACPKTEAPLPEPEPGGAPIERALGLWGDASVGVPGAADAGYILAATNPLVDQALANPLGLPAFAEQLGASLDAAQTPSAVLMELRSHLPPVAMERGPTETPAPGRSLLPSPTELLDSPRGKLQVAHLPEAVVASLRTFCGLLEAANAAADRWDVRGGGPRRPDKAAEEFFIEADSTLLRARSHRAGPDLDFVEAAAGLDTRLMVEDTAALLAGVEAALPALREAIVDLPTDGGTLLRLDTNLGPIVLGGMAGDTHSGNAALLIDPGGSDLWANNAGSNLGVRSRVALAIDLGGSDRYEAARAHTQGAGVAGVGILIDAGPEADAYRGSQHSQGAGFLGVGVLWDQGGDDVWEADQYAQGAGTFGVGLLMDSSGHERMSVRGRGQGFASTGGIGALVDLDGFDQRRLGMPGVELDDPYAGGGQGASWGLRPFPWAGRAALPGGLGLLYDRAGNDGLYARAFAQGQGWFGGVGLLLDRAGDDTYTTEIEGQGSASHHAVGVLVDSAGNDRYEGTARVQGAADDNAVGLLFDAAGDDVHLVHLTGGAAPRELGPGLGWARRGRSLGLVVNADGDDRYLAAAQTMGWALPSSRPDQEPRAALIDAGGDDGYGLAADRPGATPSDGAVWLQGINGLGIDQPSARIGWEGIPWPGSPAPPPAAVTPDLAGNDTARWLALRALYDARIAGEDVVLPEGVTSLALGDPSAAVRREAARVLAASGDTLGVDILVDSLTFLSEDNDPTNPSSSLVLWLGLLTGQQHGFEPAKWRTGWGGRDEAFDLPARWQALAALIRARRLAGSSDLTGARAACEDGVDRLPHEGPPRRLCAGLLNQWATALADPASGDSFDPEAAVLLAQQAVIWAPSRKEGFLTLARAFLELGEDQLASSALTKAEVLDSDDRVLLTLQRRLRGGGR